VRSGAVDVIVIDSVAAMVTKAEIDGEMGDMHVGQLARLMSQAMRKLTSVISKSNCVAIFINQVREKIGIIYGNPETTPGGRALKFYASVRMEVRKGEALKVGGEVVGNRTRVKVVKNKVSPPFKECEFDLLYGKGISRTGEVLDLAVDLGIVQKGGAWFSYNGVKLGQGRDNSKETLRNNPDMMKEIEEKIKEQASNLVMVSKKNKKMAMLDNAKKSAESEPVETSTTETPAESKSDAEENFEEFTPATETENNQ
jgi:recombination protein RecA